jgi:hypothetical protein
MVMVMLIGDKNLLQMWRSMGESALVSRVNLAQHVEGWRIAVDEGVARWYSGCERKGERAPSLIERRRFERKRAEITFRAASRFLGSWEDGRPGYGVAQERAITDPSLSKDYEIHR